MSFKETKGDLLDGAATIIDLSAAGRLRCESTILRNLRHYSMKRSLARQFGKALAWLLPALIAAVGGGGYWYVKNRPASDASAIVAAQGTSSGTPGSPSKDGAPKDSKDAPKDAKDGKDKGGPGARRFGSGVQPISVAEVKRRDVAVTVNAIGTLAAANTTVVRAKVEGELKSILFKEGQVVKAGQVLAEIDPRALQATLAQAQGSAARDSALLANAKLDAERYKDLLAKDSIAKQQVDSQEALVKQLQGTQQVNAATIASAALQLSYTKITAPISGRVGLRQVDLGNIIKPSDANGLVTITQTDSIYAVFAVPEIHLPAIRRRLSKDEPLVVEAWDREQKIKLATGRVAATDNVIDPATGTIKVKAEFSNADGALFPNQFVNARLQLDVVANTLVVPAAAVQRGNTGMYVFVVNADSTVTVRGVRPGATDGDIVAVQSLNLNVGEKVVVDGIDRLREGAKVDIVVVPAKGMDGPGPERRRRDEKGDKSGDKGDKAGPPKGASGEVKAEAKPTEATAVATPAPTADAPKSDERKANRDGKDSKDKKPDTAPKATSGAGLGPSAPTADGAAPAERPPWWDRLPPEVREKAMKMPQEERREFIREYIRKAREAKGEGQ